jgi:hypothetical protein
MRPWPDLVVAIVLAIVFAALADLLRFGSRIREGWRWVKDKYAESSIVAINRRIAEQEQYRNSLQQYLDSDKAFYLAILRSIVGVLLFMCLSGILLILGRLNVMPPFLSDVMSLAVLGIAIVAAITTMQLGSYDAEKISTLIQKIDAEILGLIETRTKLQKSHHVVE